MKPLLMILLALCIQAHAALEVYDSTCALPVAPKHKFYIDPVKGDDFAGTGTALKPWKTIQSIFAGITIAAIPAVPAVPATATSPAIPAIPGKPMVYIGAKYQPVTSFYTDASTGHRVWGTDPNAPVKPGDAIELATGNYGLVGIGVYTYGINPDQFLTIEPMPGAKPVFSSINMSGVGHLYFHDIKMQNTANGGALVAMSAQGVYPTVEGVLAQYPTQDVILDRMTFTSFDTTDPSTILAADWSVKAANGVSMYPFSTRCVSVTNSTFTAIAGGGGVGGEKIVFSHNKINYFRDDGVDFYGNQLRMNYNTMTNSVSTNGIHKDFFQGQIGKHLPGMTTNHYHDIVIDHNVMIGKTEAKNTLYTYVQGIDTFNEDWTNLVATNNTIIASSCHGIGFQSVHNGEIANNILRYDNLTVLPGCNRLGIAAGGTASGPTTDHVHVHHNIAQLYYLDMDHNNTWDNNIATGDDGGYTDSVGGVTNYNYVPPANDPNNNRYDRQVQQFAPAGYRYNMTIMPGSLAQTMKAGPQ